TPNASSHPIPNQSTSYKENGKMTFPTNGLDLLDWVSSYQKKIQLRNIMDDPRMTLKSLMRMSKNLVGLVVFAQTTQGLEDFISRKNKLLDKISPSTKYFK
ncbi:hypothetical protein KI387_023780, partial [Taxus chinensis]